MAMNVGGKSEGEVMSDINVTPLVDVMLVLLIIFIITIPVIVAAGAPQLAESDQSADTDEAGKHHDFGRQGRQHVLEHQAVAEPRSAQRRAARHRARSIRSRKFTSAAIPTCAISSSGRFSLRLSRSVSAKWRSSPNPIISAS